jgi:hypothetical protein
VLGCAKNKKLGSFLMWEYETVAAKPGISDSSYSLTHTPADASISGAVLD